MADDEVDLGGELGESEYNSGPFCPRKGHWSDPPCDSPCLGCDHECCRHGYDENTSCEVEGCDCKAYQDE